MLGTTAVFTFAFSLPKRFLVSDNVAFKGKKDLSTKAAARISPISTIFTPVPREEAQGAPSLGQVHLPAGGEPGSPRRPPQKRAITRAPAPAAPAGAHSPGSAVPRTNFPAPGLRCQMGGPTGGWGHTGMGRGAQMQVGPRSAPGPEWIQGDPGGAERLARPAGLGAPRRRSRRAAPEGE